MRDVILPGDQKGSSDIYAAKLAFIYEHTQVTFTTQIHHSKIS
jgi:hypothetical protein